MAKLEKELYCDFEELLERIHSGILNMNTSATLEDTSDFIEENARCSIRVFERYSAIGGNRVSLNITVFQCAGGPVKISAITSGGSQAVLFKVNTIGEKSFLDCLRKILEM